MGFVGWDMLNHVRLETSDGSGPYAVLVLRYRDSWAVRLEAVRDNGPEKVPSSDHFAFGRRWVPLDQGLPYVENESREARLARVQAAREVALALIRRTHPEAYARRDPSDDASGKVDVIDPPEVIVRALALYEKPVGHVAVAEEKQRMRALGEYLRGSDAAAVDMRAGRHSRFRNCLAAALRACNVAAQKRWALWMVDPDLAERREVEAIEGGVGS